MKSLVLAFAAILLASVCALPASAGHFRIRRTPFRPNVGPVFIQSGPHHSRFDPRFVPLFVPHGRSTIQTFDAFGNPVIIIR